MRDKTSRINIVSLVADAASQYSAAPLECARAFCLRDSAWSQHPSTSIFKTRLPLPVLDVSCPITSRPDSQECHMWVAGFVSTTLADWVHATYRADRCQSCPRSSCRLLHLLCARARRELHVTATNRQVLQGPNNSTVESALLHVQVSIIVRLLLDGSSCTWRWRWFGFVSSMLCNTTLKCFSLGTISVLSLHDTGARLPPRSLSRFFNGSSVRG